MMTNQHMSEPWTVKGRCLGISEPPPFRAESVEPNICEMNSSLPPETVTANAKRIVACVNACEGLTNPETQIPALRKLAAECVELRSVKRELLVFAEQALPLIDRLRKISGGDGDITAAGLRAVIARAKGQP